MRFFFELVQEKTQHAFNPLERRGKVKVAIYVIPNAVGLAWEIRASSLGESRSEIACSVGFPITLLPECLLDFCSNHYSSD